MKGYEWEVEGIFKEESISEQHLPDYFPQNTDLTKSNSKKKEFCVHCILEMVYPSVEMDEVY